MTGHQDIAYNITGQSLTWDAPEGRPSSVTSVTVYQAGASDDGTTEAATTGSGTIEANPDTTLDAAAGISQANARLIPLTATTGIEIGRFYLIENATGEQEWVEVVEIDDGVSVTARYQLANDYASGDSFVSTRITIDIDDTWVAALNKVSDDSDPNPGYRVRWVYVEGDRTRVHHSYFDLVRYPSTVDITPADVAAVVPDWTAHLPGSHREDNGKRLIQAAYDEVVFELHNAGRADEMARNKWVIRQLVIRGAVYQRELARLRETGTADDRFIKAEERFYTGLQKTVTVTAKIPFATGSGGGGQPAEGAPVWRR